MDICIQNVSVPEGIYPPVSISLYTASGEKYLRSNEVSGVESERVDNSENMLSVEYEYHVPSYYTTLILTVKLKVNVSVEDVLIIRYPLPFME